MNKLPIYLQEKADGIELRTMRSNPPYEIVVRRTDLNVLLQEAYEAGHSDGFMVEQAEGQKYKGKAKREAYMDGRREVVIEIINNLPWKFTPLMGGEKHKGWNEAIDAIRKVLGKMGNSSYTSQDSVVGKKDWLCGKCDQEATHSKGEPIPEHSRHCEKRNEEPVTSK